MTYTIRSIPLADLHPDPDNSRIHNRRNIDTIKKSLDEFGQYRKMVVRKSDNLIVIGNGMYQAMKELGWTEAECRIADLTEEQTRQIRYQTGSRTKRCRFPDSCSPILPGTAGPTNPISRCWPEPNS